MEPIHRPARILLAEDDASVRIMLGELLNRERFTVIHARDGVEASSALEEDPPDLVVTDYNMPGMNGWDLALLVRKRFPDTPVILITGEPNGLARAYTPGNPFDGVLAKPFQMSSLLSTIHALLDGGGHSQWRPHGEELPCEHQP